MSKLYMQNSLKWQKGVKIPTVLHKWVEPKLCVQWYQIQAKHCSALRSLESFFGNVLPMFNTDEHTVLVQAIYVKWVSWGSLYICYTSDKTHLETKNEILMTAIQQRQIKWSKSSSRSKPIFSFPFLVLFLLGLLLARAQMERKKIIVTGIELVLENYMKMLGPYKRIKSSIFGMLANLSNL